ncbi:hypothetical protein FGSG_13779 [Fusarium graminearum PH-1]|uniref:Chromosome 1, complete genome n=1 Tax=Gibberella zeae (strain ATCC MYA-4620 / CBS 123657 / FGSC 9075 / NRRL 31084 / PH-1) TaxID=229533 RepID=I1SA98_GIBZE|nr:hypothetical protein FGSG_13779 [Fusarium graminearum PH-1]ESU17256.1 hypothetical protein FGSG_13779 [Fusarium graminearum PH-1]CEF75968.1 unnamed protein product [Fusarium graminearum]|eukprot:XP_011319518.1 hypothetical protein FGSG_13779 [Fusarium graminearum PH-1]
MDNRLSQSLEAKNRAKYRVYNDLEKPNTEIPQPGRRNSNSDIVRKVVTIRNQSQSQGQDQDQGMEEVMDGTKSTGVTASRGPGRQHPLASGSGRERQRENRAARTS